MTIQSSKLQSSGHPSPESELQKAICGELEASGYEELSEIECECSGGRIVLRGTVPNFHLKQQALHAAMRAADTVEIDNEIEVTPEPAD